MKIPSVLTLPDLFSHDHLPFGEVNSPIPERVTRFGDNFLTIGDKIINPTTDSVAGYEASGDGIAVTAGFWCPVPEFIGHQPASGIGPGSSDSSISSASNAGRICGAR
jgi:hypothetical protein